MHDRRVTGRLGLNTNGDKDMHPAIGKTGGCQCTAVRYELIGIPKMLYACHCSDCQKQSASAFGMSLITSRDDVNFSQGQERLKTWDTRGIIHNLLVMRLDDAFLYLIHARCIGVIQSQLCQAQLTLRHIKAILRRSRSGARAAPWPGG